MKSTRFVPLVLAVMLMMPLVGCDQDHKNGAGDRGGVAKEIHSKTEEQVVAERAEARWRARIAKDWKAAYGYMSPGYRATHDYETFAMRMARVPLVYRKASVEKVACPDDNRCNLVLKVETEYRGSLAQFQGQVSTSRVEEQWIKVDGQWWFGR